MLETIVLLCVVVAISAWLASAIGFTDADLEARFKVPEDSVLKRHFLTQLKSEIESSKNSALKRRYRKLVAAELKNF